MLRHAMRRGLNAIWAILTIMPLLSACGLQPLPRVAAPGTTITIVVPPALHGGFGRVIVGDPMDPTNNTMDPYEWDKHDSREDLQRGELIFRLEQVGMPSNSYYLDREYVTRVRVENVTPIALGGTSSDLAAGQVIALLRIPSDVSPVPATYQIFVERYRRNESTGSFELLPTRYSQYDVQDWVGWAGISNRRSDPIPIEIVDCSRDPVLGTCPDGEDTFTQLLAWAGLGGVTWGPGDITEADLDLMTPFPAVHLLANSGGVCLAALEFDVEYPVEKFAIRGVTSAYEIRSDQTYVQWSTEAPLQPVACDGTIQTDTLSVQIISPNCNVSLNGRQRRILIAFSPRRRSFVSGGPNGYGATCPDEGGRAVVGDFEIVNLRGYDPDGNEVSYNVQKSAAFM